MCNSKYRINIFSSDLMVSFIMIDLLMLPYLRSLHCSFGNIFILIWSLFYIRKISLKTILAAIFIFMSNLIGNIYYNIGLKGIYSAGIVIYIFFLYDFFMYVDIGKRIIIKKILSIYFFFIGVMSIIYVVKPEKYFFLRSFWSMNKTTIKFSDLMINRFTHIFSDPNNAGCIILALLLYILVYEKIKIIYLIFGVISVIVTFSVSANVLMAIILILFYFIKKQNKEQKYNKKILNIFIILILILFFINISIFIKSDLIQTLSKRLIINSNNKFGGRLPIWINVLKNINPFTCLLFGRGVVIDLVGIIYQPHNGVLYLIYCYGLGVLIIFFKKFFKILHKQLIYYLPFLPILINIFINTGFLDYRFMTLTVLIIAMVHSK